MKMIKPTTLALALSALIPCAAMAASNPTTGTITPGALMGGSLQKIVTNTGLTDQSVLTGNKTLSTISNELAFGQNDIANLFTLSGVNELQKNMAATPQTMTQQQLWQIFCNGNEASNWNYSTTWVDTDSNTVCADSISLGNANSILPLDMPLQSNVTLATAKVATSGNSTNVSLTPVTTKMPNIDSYIGTLLSAPPAAQGIASTDADNNAPELTLVSGVLRSINQDYQSGEMTNIMNAVKQPFAVDASGKSAFQTKLANANTPELMRMQIIQSAQANYLNAQGISQRQKIAALLAVILADQVKIRSLQTAQIEQGKQLSDIKQLLKQILSTDQQIAEKGK